MSVTTALGRAFVLGAITGSRSMLGAAVLGRRLAKEKRGSTLRIGPANLPAGRVANIVSVLAGGELIADKLPGVPARIAAGPLLFRAVMGAVVGGASCAEDGDNVASGALIGAGAAVAVSFGAFYLRRWLTQEVGLPDPLIAAAEDGLAYAAGKYVTG